FVARIRSPETRRRPTVSSRGPSDLAHTVRGSAIMVTPQTNSTGAVPVLGLPSNTPSLTGWRPMVPQPAPHYRHGIKEGTPSRPQGNPDHVSTTATARRPASPRPPRPSPTGGPT